jgi:adenine phosphoribosyltransferase
MILDHKRVVLIDDVISTGSTLQGMQMVVTKAGGEIAGRAAIFTEGEGIYLFLPKEHRETLT